MRKGPFFFRFLVLPLLVVGVLQTNGAFAQQEDRSLLEEELLDLVQKLRDELHELRLRVDDLEKGPVEEKSPAKERGDLEERVDLLETAAAEDAGGQGNDIRVFWKDGLRFESKDKRYKLSIGGRVQWDVGFIKESNELRGLFGEQEDGSEIRRVRLAIAGSLYAGTEFKVQLDFANNSALFRDVYMGISDLPVVGNIRAGQFKEPFSLEQLTSSNYITFMERSMGDLFAPGRNQGVMVSNRHFDDRFTWALGVFRDAGSGQADLGDGEFGWTGRVTGLPWYKDEGRKLLHLGLAYSYRNPEDPVRFRARPEAHLSQFRYVDTGSLLTDRFRLLGSEFAFVYGPFSAQGEYIVADLDTVFGGAREFSSYYLEASYFLTGEHRPYSKKSATFGRVIPNTIFRGEDEGTGAWQLALRYSHIDLDDGFVRGGQEENWTAGVNWYLNRTMRVMLNYVHGEIDGYRFHGDVDVLQTRFQVTF